MVDVPWDNVEVVDIDFLPIGATVTADYYSSLLKQRLFQTVCKK
jgi:hypothetical protein